MQRVDASGFAVIGISHRVAALTDRERFLAVAAQPDWQLAGRQDGWLWESLVLATCNRVEVCLAAPDIDAAVRNCRQVLDAAPSHAYVGVDAARYLGRVASGLESLVMGEHEISGQLRRAAAEGRTAGTSGVLIDRVVSGALGASGRVRSETTLGTGGLSVAAAALALAEHTLPQWREARTLVIGAGPVGREILTRWSRRGHRTLTVASRSPRHAQQAAEGAGAARISLDAVPVELRDVDVAFIAVRTPGWMLDAETCQAVMNGRGNRPLLVVDLSVPRAVDPRAARLPGLTVRSIDDLGAVRLAAQHRRERAIPAATAIVDEEGARTFAQFLARVARRQERAA